KNPSSDFSNFSQVIYPVFLHFRMMPAKKPQNYFRHGIPLAWYRCVLTTLEIQREFSCRISPQFGIEADSITYQRKQIYAGRFLA
ncbi:MAG: hypothetical protein KDA77_18985, partial [Planctomycetaceae bacterium]|nr:hypothetical protein [Planctomycetaceae bacterium]